MGKRKVEKACHDERVAAQERLRVKYGEAKILEAEKRLCDNCSRQYQCLLLPLTTFGEDCPYFSDKGVASVP